jgi:hypothetical protein
MSQYESGNAHGPGTVAEQAHEKVQHTAQQASRKASEVVRGGAEARAQQLSGELTAAAHALKRSGHALHADGREPAAVAVDGVTRGIEQLSRYLESTSGDRMLHDLEAFGRRRPWGMIGIGVGLGVAASRFLKASSRSRYDASQRRHEFSSPPMPPGPSAPSYDAPRVPAAPVTAGHAGNV